MANYIKRRAAAGTSLAALAVVYGPLSCSTAFAAPAAGTETRYIQMEVVNNSPEKTDLQFFSKDTQERGWTKGADRGGISALPSEPIPIEGNSQAKYAMAMTGTVKTVGEIASASFNNYFNVRATSAGASGDATTGTIEAEKDWTHETNTLKTNGEGDLKLKLEATSPDSKEFSAKYRLTISSGGYSHPDKDPDLGPSVTHADPTDRSTFDIAASATLKIDVPLSSKDSGKQLQLYHHNGTLAQQWKVLDTKAGGGYYQIRNAGNGLCLEISGADPKPGDPVQQYRCDPNAKNQANQLWKFSSLGSDSAGTHVYKIVSKTGLAVDVGGPDLMEGAPLIAGSGRSWRFQTPVNNVAGMYRQAIDSLEPNTDYKMEPCYSINGTETRPQKLAVNGREYTWDEMSSGNGHWVTTNSHGQVLFDSPSSFRAIMCSFRPAMPAVKVTRLTNEAAEEKQGERPVYRVDMAEQTRTFDGELRNDIPVAPYSVEGIDKSNNKRHLGKVMPISAPKIDRTAKRVTFGAATFYYQDEPGDPEVTKLRISGPYRAAKEINLADAIQPPDEMLLSTDLNVTPATGQSVTANGLSQEPLKLKILQGTDKKAVSPDSELGKLYNYIYFVDNQEKLITNFFKEGGYPTVTPVRGAYVNTLPAAQAANDPLVYFSTTAGNPVTTKARLDIGPFPVEQKDFSQVSRKGSTTGATDKSAATTGVAPANGQPVTDPESGALYYKENGATAQAGILTRYEAVTSFKDLPVRSPYFGYLEPQFGGTVLRLHSVDGLQDTTQLETGFVTADGTHSSEDSLLKNPPKPTS